MSQALGESQLQNNTQIDFGSDQDKWNPKNCRHHDSSLSSGHMYQVLFGFDEMGASVGEKDQIMV